MSDEILTEIEENLWIVEDPEEFLFKTIVEATGNRLLLRIWVVINEYVKFIYEEQTHVINKECFDELVIGLRNRDVAEVLSAYEKITM